MIKSIFLYSDSHFSAESNTNIPNSSIDYLLFAKRFESALFKKTSFAI